MLSMVGAAGIPRLQAGEDVNPKAGLDVLDLREALIRDRAKIEYLQGYIRKITEPVGLGLKAP